MKKITLTIVAFLGLIAGAMAQATATHQVDITINSVAMIRAVNAEAGNATNSAFTVGAPNIAGEKPIITGTNKNVLYLQYTSIKASTGTPRTIKATLSSTTPVDIHAGMGVPSGGNGETGTNFYGEVLSTTATTMIGGIGSCYTGADAGKGSNVTYNVFLKPSMTDLKATASTALTVTYTLSSE